MMTLNKVYIHKQFCPQEIWKLIQDRLSIHDERPIIELVEPSDLLDEVHKMAVERLEKMVTKAAEK